MISDMIATCESMKINFDEPATEGFLSKIFPKAEVYDSPNKAFDALMVMARKNNYEFKKGDAAKKRLSESLVNYKVHSGVGKLKTVSTLKSINGIPVIVTTKGNAVEGGKPSTVIFTYLVHKNGDSKDVLDVWYAKCASLK
jgi:hypothetical protein